ncbi:O-antigen ligase family protein [Mucilaginibacter sp. UR6-11]|uniref:O-antigen ligase family protein n=1 Tax=Mucilaginibacter sp. UR6-11 TaxID=1435644 RepID=UPI001E5F17A4|nr:O-antigen ligase family protein [Mucilaginibacter sp. UR6-11]
MNNQQKPAPDILQLEKKSKSFFQDLKKKVLIEKLYNPVGAAFFILLAAILGVGAAKFGIVFGALFLLVLIGLPCIYGIVAYPQFGILVLLMMAYMLFYLGRLGIPGPLGVVIDLIQGMLMLATLVSLRRHNDWELLKGPISVIILIWIGYNIFQLGNPSAVSRLAWVYTVRSVAIVMLSYFVFVYNIRSVKFIRLIFKIWLVMSLFAALYAMKQEYIGFSATEEAYLNSDPEIRGLLFIAGHWRKFSIFSDPVAFAYNMSMSAIFCIALIAGKLPGWKKLILGGLTVVFLFSMLFSGTRGANVLVPAALVLFAILNYSKKVLAAVCLAAVFLVVLINVPTGDPNLLRFQTAFSPNDDPSYKLRKFNQERIKPYILSHPIGFGLGATGGWGKRFGDGSIVSQFQPDSGYIRVAVELGWIGLFIFCTLMFTIMRTGINNYYQIKDPEIKTYCLAILLIIFAYNIANFPQEALVQFPSNVFFSLDMALLTVLLRLDKEKQLNEASSLNKPA